MQKSAKNKYVAKHLPQVANRGRQVHDALQSALTVDTAYHNVVPQNKGGAGASAFSRFNQAYELRTDIEKRPDTSTCRSSPRAVPQRPSRGKKGSGDGSGGMPAVRGGFPGGPDQ